ncbi:hypothetical protein DFH11DRAFT_391415 [Phellopilus nigrolimitatus]|nr:hypothetical protein DFH11DRAFT_391415 [Phellopilus nigrolimitatus]
MDGTLPEIKPEVGKARSFILTSPTSTTATVTMSGFALQAREFGLRALAGLLSYYPIMVPSLLIFTIESASSLKMWQAIQRIPCSRPAEAGESDADALQQKERVRKSALWKKVIGVVILCTFFMSVLLVPKVFILDATTLKFFYLGTLFVPVTILIAIATATLDGYFVRTVVRNVEGKPAVVMKFAEGRTKTRMIFIAVWSTICAFCAFWFGLSSAVFVVNTAFLQFFFGQNVVPTRAKFKAHIVVALILTVMTSGIGLTMIFVENVSLPISVFGVDVDDNVLVDWNSIFMSTFWSASSFNILSMCYRFDYANALPADFKPLVSKKPVGFYIRYGKHGDANETFPTPYFTAAIDVYIFAYVIVALLSTGGVIKCRVENVGAYLLYIAFPAMGITILLLATARGELRKLWRYEEDWNAIPSASEPPETVGSAEKGEKDVAEEIDLISFDHEAKNCEQAV